MGLVSYNKAMNPRYKIYLTDSTIKENVKKSYSITELCRISFGRETSGRNKYLTKKIEELGIDTSHWLGKRIPKKSIKFTYSIEEVFCFPSNVAPQHVKTRALREGLLEEKCYECEITEWRGKPITLHLDHINGEKLDNRLENLRILCPNCHQQTDTWGTKNFKRKIRKTPEEIFELSKKKSNKQIAKEFGVDPSVISRMLSPYYKK